MLIRFALGLLLAALAILACADILLQFYLPLVPGLLGKTAVILLLLSFLLMLLPGCWLVGKTCVQSIKGYFSRSERQRRKGLFFEYQKLELTRMFQLRQFKINYIFELKRKKLLHRDNCQQIKSLSKLIGQQLQQQKQRIPVNEYKQLHAEYRRCLKKGDMPALLKLQRHITALIGC